MRRLCLSDLEIELREGTPGAFADLWPGYARFPSWHDQAALTIEVHRVPALPPDRQPGPLFPAFERAVTPSVRDGADAGVTMRIERYDAWGEIQVNAARGARPSYSARFTVGPSPNSLEACLRIAISAALPSTGALLMHSSAIELDGKAHVFSGVSGAGKSTISTLLAEREGLPKLADELLLLQAPCAPGQTWRLIVAPFLGAVGLPHGRSIELGALHLLVQAPRHRRVALGRAEALREVMRHVMVYAGLPGTAENVLALVDQLCAEVPIDLLEFELTTAIAPILRAATTPGA